MVCALFILASLAALLNLSMAATDFAYGHALFTSNALGNAGHWGIFKTFRIQHAGGILNTRACFWSPSCGLPNQATFTNFSTESWFCEDEADLCYEFLMWMGIR